MSQFTERDVMKAVADLAKLRYFPGEPDTRASIGAFLAEMVPSYEALRWLVKAMDNRVGEWKGPVELRRLLCERYTPADGVLPGEQQTPEQRYLAQQASEYDRKVEAWKREAAVLDPAPETKLPKLLAEAKRLQ